MTKFPKCAVVGCMTSDLLKSEVWAQGWEGLQTKELLKGVFLSQNKGYFEGRMGSVPGDSGTGAESSHDGKEPGYQELRSSGQGLSATAFSLFFFTVERVWMQGNGLFATLWAATVHADEDSTFKDEMFAQGSAMGNQKDSRKPPSCEAPMLGRRSEHLTSREGLSISQDGSTSSKSQTRRQVFA